MQLKTKTTDNRKQPALIPVIDKEPKRPDPEVLEAKPRRRFTAKYKLRISKNIEQWVQDGNLVSDEVEDFHEDVFLRWENEFHNSFRKCTNVAETIDSAMDLLTMLRRERFRLSETDLDTKLSNGELYYLSDIGRIGWHRDWRDND